ncbi:MAG TPA: glycosyl hydrolase [Prolixibacteraceae bacterium]|nr:glycosyl hydrolase [Prolixibacteraceae bacterium]
MNLKLFVITGIAISLLIASCKVSETGQLKEGFVNPPDAARPGVYWYFMDGNLSREAITADLKSMKKAGIGNVLFLEVNVGVPRGPVDFLSDQWQDLFKHAVKEAERLGIEFTLGSGPGWAGSGGPWVKPEQSMRHLVASEITVKGPAEFNGQLKKPDPRMPYFGERALTESLKKEWKDYFQDKFVLAFPTPKAENRIADSDEKALYYRAPYTSTPKVKPLLPAPAAFTEIPGATIDQNKIVDLTDKLQADGKLHWQVPEGNWTILRFGLRNNGAVTRPAPRPGLGFECDKFDTAHFNAHFDAYMGKLLQKTGLRKEGASGGWTMIHIDSWEMGAQNWSDHFREKFIKRRGYDPFLYLPAYLGKIVGSVEQSERFLWDVRQTSMELVLENHAGHFKELGRRYGLKLSIEPYDMNPASDLDLGAIADVPMCEFWSKGFGFNSSFSCIEATSIAHVYGQSVVGAESFTGDGAEAWKMYPGSMKNQGDWAFCMGINKFVYHTFAHKAFNAKFLPGITMGPYGVHWDRGQTWWPMVPAYHRYIARCQYVLRQGKPVADILFLNPEGAPLVFRAPHSALEGDEVLPDKKGYNFDACSPKALMEKADVKDHRIVFPEGASYSVLVLPDYKTMTPELLQTIELLIKKGAVIIGRPPFKSPGLTNYPSCDTEVENLAKKIWGSLEIPAAKTKVQYGEGEVYWGGSYSKADSSEFYPNYETIAGLLDRKGMKEDFTSGSGTVRYIHRVTKNEDIYFISNRTDSMVETTCAFRTVGVPELWDPLTGEIRALPEYKTFNGQTSIPLKLDKFQSFFIVFGHQTPATEPGEAEKPNFPEIKELAEINGCWEVSFDPQMGGPGTVTFDSLTDWSINREEGIRYYSGIATYTKTFDLPEPVYSGDSNELFIDVGEVKNMARVKLNGKDLGVLWTTPWNVNISDIVKPRENKLEVEVANLWANRLIGDENLPDDGVKDGKWPEWLLEGEQRTSGRITFTTSRYYKKDMPLFKSGLLGPIKIMGR